MNNLLQDQMQVELSETVEIRQEENQNSGTFYMGEGGKRLAQLTYSKAGAGLMIIDHTEVSDALKGKGAGKQLVTAAVEFARKNKLKILPLCPFAKSVFDRVKEFGDVLDR